MPRTTITLNGNAVILKGLDPMTGEDMEREFWIPQSGGYVREGSRHSADDPQVCVRLAGRGNTLDARDGGDLLRVIRREWASYRKWAQKEIARYA